MPPSTSSQPYASSSSAPNRNAQTQLSTLQNRHQALAHLDPMKSYRASRDAAHHSVLEGYTILGFISSGTYGRVYKAQVKVPIPLPGNLGDGLPEEGRPGDLPSANPTQIYAIKKFKPDKEGDSITYTGISQSAIREIGLNRELSCSASVGSCHHSSSTSSNRSASFVPGASRKRKVNDPTSAEDDEKRKAVHVARCRANLCENLAALKEVILEDKAIYMVFEYAEHDFLVS